MMSCQFRVSSFIHTGILGFFCVLLAMSCAPSGGRRSLHEPDPCAMLDSLYQSSGFESAMSMTGKITFDVEQYRIRGQFALTAHLGGDVAFEFSNSALFGSQHEDIAMSIADGVVRALDRERGRYYEGAQVDEQLIDMIGLDLDVREMISLILGAPPDCGGLQDTKISLSRSGEVIFDACAGEGDVRIVFDEEKRRIRRLEWPVRFDNGHSSRLTAEYLWEESGRSTPVLARLVLLVEEKNWRIKLVSVL
ncbi:MAG: hypothetical protein ABIA59_00850 [Candidatus Latescibacterota bacterium]